VLHHMNLRVLMFTFDTFNHDVFASFSGGLWFIKESQVMDVFLMLVLFQMIKQVWVLELLSTSYRTRFLIENSMSAKMFSVILILELFLKWLAFLLIADIFMVLYNLRIVLRNKLSVTQFLFTFDRTPIAIIFLKTSVFANRVLAIRAPNSWEIDNIFTNTTYVLLENNFWGFIFIKGIPLTDRNLVNGHIIFVFINIIVDISFILIFKWYNLFYPTH
jgi:hypothetical protein